MPVTVSTERVPGRRGRPGHSLDSLLDAAVALFNERGYEATSMDELAVRLGVTKSAIYHHVPSKVELLRLALDRALDALFALTQEPGATTGPAIDRLEYVVRGSVRVLAAELPFVTLLLRLRGNTEVERSEEHTSELQSRLHLVCRLLLEKKKIKNTTKLTAMSSHWQSRH